MFGACEGLVEDKAEERGCAVSIDVDVSCSSVVFFEVAGDLE